MRSAPSRLHSSARMPGASPLAEGLDVVKQLEDVGRISMRLVIAWVGIVLRFSAAPELDGQHPPFAGQAVGDRLEVPRITGQAGKAEDRRPVARAVIVAVMQAQTIGTVPVAIDPLRHAISLDLRGD